MTDATLFPGFDARTITLAQSDLHVVTGGGGPALLLLHGFPQTHAIWHKIAPALAARYTLVMPDLRGYGASVGPEPDAEHRHYAKRAMAAEMVELMRVLGHERFLLAGHDRGGRVGYRLALDHPASVTRFAAIDIIPTWEMWARMGKDVASSGYHWLFLAQPAPMPETLIGADPDFYLEHLISRWAGRRDRIAPEAYAEYQRAYRRASVIAATCADYRAGMTRDYEDDDADRRAGRRIDCPLLVLWGRGYMSKRTGTPADVWRDWATDVRDVPLDCGHFVVEEEPEAAARALIDFFGGA
jgi:haloacetate dehalogenase